MHEIEVWVVVDEKGDYGAGNSEESAAEQYDSDVGSGTHTPKRVICVKLQVPAPTPITLSGTVPAEPQTRPVDGRRLCLLLRGRRVALPGNPAVAGGLTQ